MQKHGVELDCSALFFLFVQDVLDTLVDVADEGGWFLAPLFIEGGGGFGGDGFFEGLAFFFEFGNIVACGDEHVTEFG